jgi:hypothetical protein
MHIRDGQRDHDCDILRRRHSDRRDGPAGIHRLDRLDRAVDRECIEYPVQFHGRPDLGDPHL